jgi:hypothetical protein
MVGPVGGGGFAPMGGGFSSPVSSGGPAGGAAKPAGIEGLGGAQGPEGLNTTAGKAHSGESGFDARSALEAADAAAKGGQKQAEDVVAQMVNALEQLLKNRPSSGQDPSGADAVGGASGAKANGAQNPNDPPTSIAEIMQQMQKPMNCPACMGVPGPHNH